MVFPSQADLEQRLAAFHDPPSGIGMHEIDVEHRIRRVKSRRAERKFSPDQELKPFLRDVPPLRRAGVPMLLLDRRLIDKRGQVIGLRTAMTVTPSNP